MNAAPTDTHPLSPALRAAMAARLLALADDELLLAHRDSEWTGHAPILEEDIALANLAQDELGHAGLWYGLLQELDGREPDELVYFRDAPDWRAARLLQLPRGDWAFTLLRHHLFDHYEALLLPALQGSAWQPLADAAAVARREEVFHLRHTRMWLDRLGRGTPESNARAQAALDALWPHLPQLFAPLPGEEALVEAAVFPDVAALRDPWRERVEAEVRAADLRVPPWPDEPPAGRDVPTEHLEPLLAELQEVARAHPGAVW